MLPVAAVTPYATLEHMLAVGTYRAYTATTWAALRSGPRAALRAALRPTLHAELCSNVRRTNDSYCTTALLDRRMYNAGYILMEIETPRPWCLQPGVITRLLWGSDEVC